MFPVLRLLRGIGKKLLIGNITLFTLLTEYCISLILLPQLPGYSVVIGYIDRLTHEKKKYSLITCSLLFGLVVLLNSCRTIPKGVTAVEPFYVERYLGKWYEIARLDFSFEKDLNNVTAEYTLNPDSSIKVVNRGYNYKTQEWKESEGKAKFAEDPDEGMLEVSFFGPFYSGYNVIAIDKDYTYALVAGKNRDYLWILSREKTIPQPIRQQYLDKAEQLGFPVDELIWTHHD